jgi:hypothetical protein
MMESYWLEKYEERLKAKKIQNPGYQDNSLQITHNNDPIVLTWEDPWNDPMPFVREEFKELEAGFKVIMTEAFTARSFVAHRGHVSELSIKEMLEVMNG